jgi:GTPase SAR1 family protein
MLVGDSHVGKSNLIIRFCDNIFNVSHVTTIGKHVLIELNPNKILFNTLLF